MSSGAETGMESESDDLTSKAVVELITAFDQRIAHVSFPDIARGALAFLSERRSIARASVALLMGEHGPFRIFDSTCEILGIESGKLVPSTDTSLMAVIERGESIYRPDVDDRPSRNPVDKALLAAGMRSTFSTPLVCAGRCIGTLNAASTAIDGLGPVTRRLIELLAPRLAFGIHASIIHDQLRESEARFRDVFVTVGDGILVADIGTRKLVMANPAICKLLGRTTEELVGSTIELIHPPEHLAEVLRTFLSMLDGGVNHALDIPMLCSDGKVILVDVAARSTTLSGRPCVVGAFRDASSRREREQEQVQIQKLESIRTLAAGIAHDFNNLLTGLVGNMSLVQAHIDHGSDAWEWLGEAQRAAVRATGLTRQLLTFARGGAPIRRATDLVPVVRDSASLACAGSNVRCSFQLPEHKVMVLGDEGQLAQVVQNLVRNAVDAMPGGGTVEINARIDSRRTGQRPPEVCVEVVDHGQGIAPELLDRIFVPFFTTKPSGSGLGLAVAYSVVQSHGGRITVSSGHGTGATFQVFLPLMTEQAAVVEGATTPSQGIHGHILIMDDQAVVRRVAERILVQAGYTTHAVTNGSVAALAYREALQNHRRFDAAILDLTVPGGMGGREAAALILEVDPKATLVVSSGYSDEAVMSEHAQHGFRAVLPKPYDATQLLSTVASVLRPDGGSTG